MLIKTTNMYAYNMYISYLKYKLIQINITYISTYLPTYLPLFALVLDSIKINIYIILITADSNVLMHDVKEQKGKVDYLSSDFNIQVIIKKRNPKAQL